MNEPAPPPLEISATELSRMLRNYAKLLRDMLLRTEVINDVAEAEVRTGPLRTHIDDVERLAAEFRDRKGTL